MRIAFGGELRCLFFVLLKVCFFMEKVLSIFLLLIEFDNFVKVISSKCSIF